MFIQTFCIFFNWTLQKKSRWKGHVEVQAKAQNLQQMVAVGFSYLKRLWFVRLNPTLESPETWSWQRPSGCRNLHDASMKHNCRGDVFCFQISRSTNSNHHPLMNCSKSQWSQTSRTWKGSFSLGNLPKQAIFRGFVIWFVQRDSLSSQAKTGKKLLRWWQVCTVLKGPVSWRCGSHDWNRNKKS